MAKTKKSARQASPPKKRKSTSQSTKRTRSSKQAAAAKPKKQPQRSRSSGATRVTAQTLDALNERLDIMLPEVMFRIAAIERLLVRNQLCSYEELIHARQFIQEQEQS